MTTLGLGADDRIVQWQHFCRERRALPLAAAVEQLGETRGFRLELRAAQAVPIPDMLISALTHGGRGSSSSSASPAGADSPPTDDAGGAAAAAAASSKPPGRGQALTTVQLGLSVSLYDEVNKTFFGRTWHVPPQLADVRALHGTYVASVAFGDVGYYHSSIIDASCVAVVEISAHLPDKRKVSLGWTVADIFQRGPTLPVFPTGDRDASLLNLDVFSGSPRLLLMLNEPMADILPNGRKHPECKIVLSCMQYPDISRISHLVPENSIIARKTIVPGMVPSQLRDLPAPLDKDIVLAPTIPCLVDNLHIQLEPSVADFEAHLIRHLKENHLKAAAGPAGSRKSAAVPPAATNKDSLNIHVVERRLHVRVHNGHHFVHEPHIAHLTVSATENSLLVFEGLLEVQELFAHSKCALVFQLEHVVTMPTEQDENRRRSVMGERTQSIVTRWMPILPFLGSSTAIAQEAYDITMFGGPSANPAGCMVFTALLAPEDARRHLNPKYMNAKLNFTLSSTDMGDHDAQSDAGTSTPRLSRRSTLRSSRKASQARSVSRERPPSGRALARRSSFSAAAGRLSRGSRLEPPSPRAMRQSTSASRLPSLQPVEESLSLPRKTAAVPERKETKRDELADDLGRPIQHQPPILATKASRAARHLGHEGDLSRAEKTVLHNAGFPNIVEGKNIPPSPAALREKAEARDELQVNEIHFQLMAYTVQDGAALRKVFVSFRFYRFPTYLSECLSLGQAHVGSAEDSAAPLPQPLHAESAGSVEPGVHVRYTVDRAFMRQDEPQHLVRFLATKMMQVDVWDAESLMLVGSAGLELRHLLRGGRAAVQTLLALQVARIDEDSVGSAPSNGTQTVGAGAGQTAKGTLYLRVANVGHKDSQLPTALVDAQAAEAAAEAARAQQLSRSKAARLVEKDASLAARLAVTRSQDSETARKAQRAEAIRRRLELTRAAPPSGPAPGSSRSAYKVADVHSLIPMDATDLRVIEQQRAKQKRAKILGLLNDAITTETTIFPSFASAVYVEHVLENPLDREASFVIDTGDPEMHPITNASEWRHLVRLAGSRTPVEEHMLQQQGDVAVVLLRPREKVTIPFKFQSFSAGSLASLDHELRQQSGGQTAQAAEALLGELPGDPVLRRTIRVKFVLKDTGAAVAILAVHVKPQPYAVDQTFRFWHAQNEFLKKVIRLPPRASPARAQRGDSDRLFLYCSNPDVICESLAVDASEPKDIRLKYACGASPSVASFCLAIYESPHMAEPLEIWQFFVHAVERIDMAAVVGQTNRGQLVVRGTQTARTVQLYASSAELEVRQGAFTLLANASNAIELRYRPRSEETRTFFVNMVDRDFSQLMATYLVVAAPEPPVITKAFELKVPRGKSTSKRVSYRNAYGQARRFVLHSSQPELLRFKEDVLDIPPGEAKFIGLRFVPLDRSPPRDILVFINDEDGRNEECFAIHVQVAGE